MEWDTLRTLDGEQRREVLRMAVRRRYRSGDTLFHQGDPGDSMHLVDRGHVAIRVANGRGDLFTVDVLAGQVRRLSDQLVDAHTMPADQRVLKQLRRVAGIFRDGATARLPITQEELASLAGTTRPTANRALQPLVAEGVSA